MSFSVDNRVVEMQFDNSNFERNVSTSMSTLEKLKHSLKFDNASEGFDRINDASKRLDFSPISDSLETVKVSFSALQVIAVSALASITNKALDAGEALLKSLSVDNISAGWTKYEQETSAVQTLVNSTGKSVEEIEGYLSRLMWFSDETSYSFTDMTSALAQMTSSGGDIDKLMPMITGIANATAFAGKGSAEFSSTIRNLAQSYQAGFLQLQDMKSLDLMGTSSKQFKETIISVAEEMGTIRKGAVTLENFSETLKNKWATSEVLETALGRFSALSEAAYQAVEAGEYDTASAAIEALAGDYDELAVRAFKSAQEAKSFTDAIDATKDAVSSGWLQTFNVIFGNYEEAKDLWTDLANSLWDVFASGAEARNEMLKEWKELGGRDALIESFWNAWKGVGSILKPIKTALEQVFPPMTADRLMELTERLKDLTSRMSITGRKIGQVREIFHGLFSVLDIGLMAIKSLWNGTKRLISAFSGISGTLLESASSLGRWLSNLRDSIKEGDVFDNFVNNIVDKLLSIPSVVQKVIDKMDSLFQSLTGSTIGEVFTTISDKIKDAISSIKDSFGNLVTIDFSGLDKMKEKTETAFNPITKILDGFKRIGQGFVNIIKQLKPVFTTIADFFGDALTKIGDTFMNADINKIAGMLTGGAAIGIGASLIDFIHGLSTTTKSLKDSIGGMGEMFESIGGAFDTLQGKVQSETIRNYAISLGILALALIGLSSIDTGKLSDTMPYMLELIAALGGIMVVLDKFTGNTAENATEGIKGLFNSLDTFGKAKEMSAIGTTLIKMAASLLIVAFALKVVSTIEPEQLMLSIMALGGLLLEMSIIMAGVGKTQGKFSSLMAMAAALIEVAIALRIIGTMAVEDLVKGVVALLVMLVAMSVSISKIKVNEGGVTGLMAMATSLIEVAIALRIVGTMAIEDLAKGVIALVVMLVAMSVSISKIKVNEGGVAGLIAMAAALVIVGASLKIVSTIPWKSLAKSVVSLLLVIGGLTAASILMSKFGAAGGAGFLAMGAGLLLIGLALKTISTIPLESLLVVGIVLGSIVAVGAIAGPAFAAAGAGMLAFGAGLILVGVGLLAINTALFVFVAAIGELVLVASTSAPLIVRAIAAIFVGIADGIAAFLVAIANNTATIIGAVTTLLVALLDAVVTIIPKIVEVAYKLITALLDAILTYLPNIMQTAINIVVAFVEGLVEGLPKIVQAAWDLIIGFIDALSEGLEKNTTRLVESVNKLFKAVLNSITTILTFGSVTDIFKAGKEIIGSKDGGGMIGGIWSIAKNMKTWITDNIIKGIVDGIGSGLTEIWNKAKDLGNTLLGGIKDALGIHSPSREAYELMGFFDQGIVNGLQDGVGRVNDAASRLGDGILNSLNDSISNVSDIVSSELNTNPTITPILDLSNVRDGVSSLSTMFARDQAMSVSAGFSGNYIQRQNAAIDGLNGTISGMTTGSTTNNAQTNYFNITGSDPKSIANEISQILQRQVERRDAQWA